MSQIEINKTVYNKDYRRIIKTDFSQLINQAGEEPPATLTVDDFFQLYEDMFYQIPKDGDTNTHQFILEKTSEYLGIGLQDIEALLAEITTLRGELLDANKQINDLLKNQGS